MVSPLKIPKKSQNFPRGGAAEKSLKWGGLLFNRGLLLPYLPTQLTPPVVVEVRVICLEKVVGVRGAFAPRKILTILPIFQNRKSQIF